MGREMQGLMMHLTMMESTSDSIIFKEYYSDGGGNFTGGRIISASKVKAEHYGLNMFTIIGKTDFDLMPEKQATKALNDDLWVMRNRMPIEDQREVITHANEEEVIVSASKFPWIVSNGEVIGVICIARNITIREKAQKHATELENFLQNEILPSLERLASKETTANSKNIFNELIEKISMTLQNDSEKK